AMWLKNLPGRATSREKATKSGKNGRDTDFRSNQDEFQTSEPLAIPSAAPSGSNGSGVFIDMHGKCPGTATIAG
ncbi:MAG: hypothetical protein ACKO5E_15880, partial [bacterium]